jgi:hypothetical protein
LILKKKAVPIFSIVSSSLFFMGLALYKTIGMARSMNQKDAGIPIAYAHKGGSASRTLRKQQVDSGWLDSPGEIRVQFMDLEGNTSEYFKA